MPTLRIAGGRRANTFVIRIIHTDDKEWTGVVSHVQSGRKTSFRGFIEAVRFMDGFIRDREADAAGGHETGV